MSTLFIVCEGMDAAGKTTSIQYALNQLGNGFLYNKGLIGDTPLGKISKEYPTTSTLLCELLYEDRIFVKKQISDYNIIQDRWYFSVLAHNEENPVDRDLADIFVPLLSKPDLLVYYTVSLEERLKRLEDRGEVKDRELIENPAIIEEREARLIRLYDDFQGNKALIETTCLSIEESGDRLVEIIHSAVGAESKFL